MMKTIKELLSNKFVLAAIYIVACLLINKMINVFYNVKKKRLGKESIKSSFTKGALKALVIIITGIQVASLSDTLSKFSNTILMSSSLLVVVLGFVFQEGLSNIIHGFIITLFKPFEIGDRLLIQLNGETISGYVKSMTLRHTVITGIMDNSVNIIPNSLLDKNTIKNLSNQPAGNKYPLTVSITYKMGMDEKKLKTAKRLMNDAVLDNPLTFDTRSNKEEPLFIKVSLEQSSVDLTCFITARSAEDNYKACSQIKERLLKDFKKAGIDFAYQHLEISGHLE